MIRRLAHAATQWLWCLLVPISPMTALDRIKPISRDRHRCGDDTCTEAHP